MPFNNAAMAVAGNALRSAAGYAQLHSAAAGTNGTSNVTAAPRQAVAWSAVTGLGDFSLSAPIAFTGGAPAGGVYSVSFWSAAASGVFYGEFPLVGDDAFNSSGEYTVTAIDLTGTVS